MLDSLFNKVVGLQAYFEEHMQTSASGRFEEGDRITQTYRATELSHLKIIDLKAFDNRKTIYSKDYQIYRILNNYY